jgi:hypothetical protein
MFVLCAERTSKSEGRSRIPMTRRFARTGMPTFIANTWLRRLFSKAAAGTARTIVRLMLTKTDKQSRTPSENEEITFFE